MEHSRPAAPSAHGEPERPDRVLAQLVVGDLAQALDLEAVEDPSQRRALAINPMIKVANIVALLIIPFLV